MRGFVEAKVLLDAVETGFDAVEAGAVVIDGNGDFANVAGHSIDVLAKTLKFSADADLALGYGADLCLRLFIPRDCFGAHVGLRRLHLLQDFKDEFVGDFRHTAIMPYTDKVCQWKLCGAFSGARLKLKGSGGDDEAVRACSPR